MRIWRGRVAHVHEFDVIPGTDYFQCMSPSSDKLKKEIESLPDVEKLRLVDAILADLDRPDPEIDRVWAEEARKRWAAYQARGRPDRFLRRRHAQVP